MDEPIRSRPAGLVRVSPRPLWQRYLGLSLALLWLAGSSLAWIHPRPWETWMGWVVAGGLLHLLFPWYQRHLRRFRDLLPWIAFLRVALAVMGLAGWRTSLAMGLPASASRLQRLAREGARVRLVGRVATAPSWKGDRLVALLAVERVHAPPAAPAQAVSGRVRLTWPRSRAPRIAYGDVLSVYGRLEPLATPAGFDYRVYLARRGVVAQMQPARTGRVAVFLWVFPLRWLFAFRERARQVVDALWPQPEAGFFAGILLGMDSAIPQRVYQAFRDTGTAHILVISGFNITIVAGLALRLLRRWTSEARAATGTVVAVVLYTLLVGADPAVLRAALMGTLALLARYLGRRQHGYTTLAVAAALMNLLEPAVLWDVSFQLSFAATLGLLLLADPLVDGFVALARRILPPPWPRRLAGPVGEFFLLTLAAQALTLPVIVFHFGRLSLISWVANPLVLPVQSPLMVLGGLALLLGLVWRVLAYPLAWAAWPLAAYSIRVAEVLARVPAATVTVPAWTFLMPYLLALLAYLLWRLGRQGRLALSRSAWLLGFWAVVAVLGRPALRTRDTRLHLWFWPSGETTAILCQRQNLFLWIHPGSQGLEARTMLDRLSLWPLPSQQIWVVASGSTRDVTGYLALLNRTPPHQVFWAPQAPGPPALRRLRASLEHARVPIVRISRNMLADVGDLHLQVTVTGPLEARVRVRYAAFVLQVTSGETAHAPLGETVAVVRPANPFASSGGPPAPVVYVLGRPMPLQQGLHLATDGFQLWMETFQP